MYDLDDKPYIIYHINDHISPIICQALQEVTSKLASYVGYAQGHASAGAVESGDLHMSWDFNHENIGILGF